MQKIIDNKVPILLFLASFTYYALLSARDYTWLYVSQDSGDWLMSASIWVVPQPMGSPLYIFLGHLVNLLPGSLEVKMTILLSTLPSAITVALVYLITRHLLGNAGTLKHLIPSIVLLGAGIFLSQSTILEEYALVTMFLVLAFWFYIKEHRKLVLLALGCATAVHVIGLLFFILWAWVEWSNRRVWWKHTWVYILSGLLPYAYVPILMATGSPPFMAGYFSWAALKQYIFNTGNAIVFQISVLDFPARLGLGLGLLVACLGLALVPSLLALHRPLDNTRKILLVSALFPLVYYLLCLDPSTWTFLTFSLPFFALLAGLGLQRLRLNHQVAVAIVAVLLVLVNPFFYNPAVIEASDSPAQDIKTQLEALPVDSVVLTYPGAYSMAVYYINTTTRPDLIPIVWQETGMGEMIWDYNDLRIQYKDYCSWLSENYGIVSDIPLEQVSWCLDNGYAVYIGAPEWVFTGGMGNIAWTQALKEWLVIEGDGRLRQVTGADYAGHDTTQSLP